MRSLRNSFAKEMVMVGRDKTGNGSKQNGLKGARNAIKDNWLLWTSWFKTCLVGTIGPWQAYGMVDMMGEVK